MHASTPWNIGKHTRHHVYANGQEVVIPADGLSVREAIDNAALIVLAVNAHSKLVDAMQSLINNNGTGAMEWAISNARALLAELEPQDTHEAHS